MRCLLLFGLVATISQCEQISEVAQMEVVQSHFEAHC